MESRKKPMIYKDKKGEYIKQQHFVRGKQKFMKIDVIDGIPADKFYEQNADSITLLQTSSRKPKASICTHAHALHHA
jgi:hypothetical protein